MRSNLLTIALAVVMITCAADPAFTQSVPIGVRGSVPICTHAQLHAGTCQLAQPGYTATITNGNGPAGNSCASGAGTGTDQITCRYKTGTGWEEFEPGAGGTDDQTATEVPFTSTIAAFVAANVRVALDYLFEQFSARDTDGNGLLEFAYIKDFDGDGSGHTICTGDATPSINCKATGEILNEDFLDDANCGIHGCGFGQLEPDGVLKLRGGVVYVGFPCFDPSDSGGTANNAANAEINDNNHDDSSDPAYTANCPVDADGKRLVTLSTQGWAGTIEGSGVDTRNLQRGTMSPTLKRDRGSYVVNNMGPWHAGISAGSHDNRWFHATPDNYRMISSGYHPLYTNPTYGNGASAADGDSKGWWKVSANANFEVFGSDDIILCLQNTAGAGAGVDYKASGTVGNLAVGDLLLVPVKAAASSSFYQQTLVQVKATPSAALCAANTLGVSLGAVRPGLSTTGVRAYPAFAAEILTADNIRVGHVRSDYRNTRFTLRNVTLEPQDFWNETGGRCSNTLGFFSNAGDDALADLSCDTMSIVGFWGGGESNLEDVVLKHGHQYIFDGNSAGNYSRLRRVTVMYHEGGAWADFTGWTEVTDLLMDQSYHNVNAFSILGPGFRGRDWIIRNSQMSYLTNLLDSNEGADIDGVRFESDSISYPFVASCGARRHSVRNVYVTGRAVLNYGSAQAGGVYVDCDNTSNPVTQNVFENFMIDSPDSAIWNEQNPIFVFRASSATAGAPTPLQAIFGNVFDGARVGGYSTGVAGNQGCAFGVRDFTDASPPVDDGESVVFTYNSFSNAAVPAGSSVFCVTTSQGRVARTKSEIDGFTPSWGDPVGCNNFDGLSPISYARCDGSQLANGAITVDFASMAAGACSSAITRTITGLTTSDSILWGTTTDLSAVTGWAPGASIMVYAYPTANTVNFKACNPTASTLDPASAVLWFEAKR